MLDCVKNCRISQFLDQIKCSDFQTKSNFIESLKKNVKLLRFVTFTSATTFRNRTPPTRRGGRGTAEVNLSRVRNPDRFFSRLPGQG